MVIVLLGSGECRLHEYLPRPTLSVSAELNDLRFYGKSTFFGNDLVFDNNRYIILIYVSRVQVSNDKYVDVLRIFNENYCRFHFVLINITIFLDNRHVWA